MTRTGKRALRPGFDNLEGRKLLTLVGTTVAETSYSAPAIATFNNHLYIAWRGTDNHINVENLDTQAKRTLDETTSAAPALAVYNNRLVVAWTGTDGAHHLNVESASDGLNFDVTTRNTLPQTTPASDGPALTASHGRLDIAWTGTDSQHKVNYALSADGKNFGSANQIRGATSPYGPALATGSNGDFYVAWTGMDRFLYVVDGQTGVSPFGGPIPVTSSGAPSLASKGDLYIAWTDADPINGPQLHVGDVNKKQSRAIGEYSDSGPSLAFAPDGTRYLAWTGTDYFGPIAGASLNYEPV
jgi:hypothetical protein